MEDGGGGNDPPSAGGETGIGKTATFGEGRTGDAQRSPSPNGFIVVDHCSSPPPTLLVTMASPQQHFYARAVDISRRDQNRAIEMEVAAGKAEANDDSGMMSEWDERKRHCRQGTPNLSGRQVVG